MQNNADFQEKLNKLQELKDRCLNGGCATQQEAEWLIEEAPKEELYAASHEITTKCTTMHFDTCSIINARSGRCSEDCKWCSQSAHYNTDSEVYPLVDTDSCLKLALKNEALGINRYGIVTSGRGQSKADVDRLCDMIKTLHKNSSIHVCASLGLVTKEQLKQLKEAGLERLHCNLEAAPSLFDKLCTTHTHKMKLATLNAAKELGIEICSGGIFGMGESAKQRVELVYALKATGTKSLPFNILNPIPGTPLENTPPLSDDEVLSTIAMIRFAIPDTSIRFAGGRARRTTELVKRAFYVGINSATMGEMLTTPGTCMEDEFNYIKEAGYSLERTEK